MRELFPEFLPDYDSETLDEIWGKAHFSFDTSVLINFTGNKTLFDSLSDLVNKFPDRIWIPAQVASEFCSREEESLTRQRLLGSDLKDTFEKKIPRMRDDLMKDLDNLFQRYDVKDKTLRNKIEKKITDTGNQLHKELSEMLPKDVKSQKLASKIDSLINKKIVGSHYTTSKLHRIYREGEFRMKKGIPPGYRDFKKGGGGKEPKKDFSAFNDLVIWYQLIDYSKKKKVPVIFVTDEEGEDWWRILNDEKRARPELIKEFKEKTNQQFVLIRPEPFFKEISTRYKIDSAKEAQSEAKKIEEIEKEELQRLTEDIKQRNYNALHEYLRTGATLGNLYRHPNILQAQGLAAQYNPYQRQFPPPKILTCQRCGKQYHPSFYNQGTELCSTCSLNEESTSPELGT